MVEQRDRPDVLPGAKQRINTGYGKMYVGINVDEDEQPFELFLHIGNSGGFTNGFCEALAKVISHDLRSGGEAEEIAESLLGIRSDKIVEDNDDQIYSIPDAIGIAMMRFIANPDNPVESAPVRGVADEEEDDRLGVHD